MQYNEGFRINQRKEAYKSKISMNLSKIKTTALNQYYPLQITITMKNFVFVQLNNGTLWLTKIIANGILKANSFLLNK